MVHDETASIKDSSGLLPPTVICLFADLNQFADFWYPLALAKLHVRSTAIPGTVVAGVC